MRIKIGIMFVMALAVTILAVPAQATVIGFESGEGYSAGDLNGQPSGGIGTWTRYYESVPGAAAGVEVDPNVGVTGAGLKVISPSTSISRYALSGIPELSSFDPNASVISYSWQTKLVTTNDPSPWTAYLIGSGSDGAHAAVWTKHQYAPNYAAEYGGEGDVFFWWYNGGYGKYVLGNFDWLQIDVTTDWATKTYDISVNGTSQGTDLPFKSASAVNGEFVVEGSSSVGAGPSTYVDDVSITAVPEPGSLFLLGTGLLSLVSLARRKRR